MEEIKCLTKLTVRNFDELEMALQSISGKNNVNYNNNESPPLLLKILRNCVSNLDKKTDRKSCDHKFSFEAEK